MQARALRYEYAMRFGHTLASAVRDETRGDLQALLLAFLDPPPAAIADDADPALAETQAIALWKVSKPTAALLRCHQAVIGRYRTTPPLLLHLCRCCRLPADC